MGTVDVMVLNDGETYTAVNGCRIVRVNTDALETDERAAITIELAPSCEVCGYAVVADASPGVWVHDPEELGDEAYELNEQHAARPPETTIHPAEAEQDADTGGEGKSGEEA